MTILFTAIEYPKALNLTKNLFRWSKRQLISNTNLDSIPAWHIGCGLIKKVDNIDSAFKNRNKAFLFPWVYGWRKPAPCLSARWKGSKSRSQFSCKQRRGVSISKDFLFRWQIKWKSIWRRAVLKLVKRYTPLVWHVELSKFFQYCTKMVYTVHRILYDALAEIQITSLPTWRCTTEKEFWQVNQIIWTTTYDQVRTAANWWLRMAVMF